MSKLKCPCGHTIIDQANNLKYKGYIIPDTKFDSLSGVLVESIDSLSEAEKDNHRLEWIKENFNVPPYPLDLKNSSMIHDVYFSKMSAISKHIYECENCGRIAIQQGKTEQFQFFSPDTKDTKGILDKE